jgi:hypothetical protein
MSETFFDHPIVVKLKSITNNLNYLIWFHENVDFGPIVYEDVILDLQQRYVRETGRPVPDDWRIE